MRGTAAIVIAALTVGLAACTAADDTEAAVRSAAETYLDAWAAGDYAAAAAGTDDPAGTETLLGAAAEWLGVAGPAGTVTAVEIGAGDTEGGGATEATAEATVRLSWDLPGLGRWEYDEPLALTAAADGRWTVTAGPDTVHPALGTGQELQVERTLAERASILDAEGTPLFTATPIVEVGVDPALVTDLPALATTLADVLGVDAAEVTASVQAGTPGQFVPVLTLRRTDYNGVRDRIYDLPGTVFREGTRQLAPSARFASAVLGRVGPATAEVVAESDGLLRPGDDAGLTGLQRVYQQQLTGNPGWSVSTTDGQRVLDVLATAGPVPGQPVRTTLVSAVQTAADRAVDAQTRPAYVVAVRPATGEILAVAANAAATPGNALTGQYPPGSTFKIVVAAAALQAGLVTAETVVPCPATNTVDGRQFENEDRFALGAVPFRTAFARSCNSTFTDLGTELAGPALPDAAAAFGLGTDWTLPVTTLTGSVPVPDSTVRQAEDSIGQGDVLVSPFGMALAAATVVTGTTPVPVLVEGAAPAGVAPPGPDPAVVQTLRDLTRAVVTDGTAIALRDLPGEVGGKTGTAEYGTGDPPPAHAWFAGYQLGGPAGDLAFAAFVEGGESSSSTAVPLSRDFLDALR